MKTRPITLFGQRLNGPRHLCAFFDSRDEQYEAFLPYFREGLENGEQVVYILDRSRHAEAGDKMLGHGIDAKGRIAQNQLQVLSDDETKYDLVTWLPLEPFTLSATRGSAEQSKGRVEPSLRPCSTPP